MAFTPPSPKLYVSDKTNVQDDYALWTKYLKVASEADERLVKDWTKIIDDLLVFVALFSGVLTAFIIQISGNFQPQPAEVTNKILIAIYRQTMNATTPIDLEQFLELDNTTKSVNDFHNWLLYISLALSILVAALAMAAKLWLVRYSREVTIPGSPRACAKRRQEIYDGLLAWKLERCIDAMPIMALAALFLFGLFIHSYVSVQRKFIGNVVGSVFLIGSSFLLVASFSAAFIFDSPFRSPFSDFVKCIFRIFPNKPIPGCGRVLWRTIGIVLVSVLALALGGYYLWGQNYLYFLFVYFAIASVFALMREGKETDMQPRFISLPLWVLISTFIVFTTFIVSSYFAYFANQSTLCILCFVIASILLLSLGYVGIKMSETKPMTVEAEAVSWLLTTSFSDKDLAWFQKAVQIAGQSPNIRAVLMKRLLPLLLPVVGSLPTHGAVTTEQESCIKTLAILMDFAPRRRCLWRNEAAVERPTLPEGLIVGLKKLQASREKCSHRGGPIDQEDLRNDGSVRCPQACVCNAVEHILQLHELAEVRNKDEQEQLILKTESA